MSANLPRVIVIEDERQIRRFVREALEQEGAQVFEAETAEAGLVEAGTRKPDLVILDLGLPDRDGVEVIRDLRAWSSLPVLILSARASEPDKILALDAGADDYLTKPFGSGELLARLRVMLRRIQSNTDSAFLCFGDIEFDRAARLVRRAGVEVHLTAKEYALFSLLVQHRGKVVTHRQILRDVWGPNAEENTHYLRVHMTHLRQKLETDPNRPALLKTESGIGYRLLV